MHDLVGTIDNWLEEGKDVALATVVKAWGSAPRPLGSKMVVSSTGEMAGSVSGGCVEGAVFDKAREVIESGVPQLLRFGVTNDEAWAVGLSCGGQIEVFVERLVGGEGDSNDA
jgi:xanthine/CO dehydrogenase XdhC/CoxF family maturation factor